MAEPEPGTYTCERCGGTFVSGRSDAEARAEAEANWGDVPRSDMAVICDGCYKALMAWLAYMRDEAPDPRD